MLFVKDLSVTYQDNEVLKNFDLSVEQGEIFAMLGDSGSGKSTALRFIAGLDQAKNGSVSLDNKRLTDNGQHKVEPEARNVGMVFQDYALFPHMTVKNNITFGISHLSRSDQNKRVQELLTLIDLNGVENKYPHQLSGGEQQRIALARALAPSPKLLLLDEPFSSLDTKHRKKLVKQVREILKKTNVTSILVTHDEEEAHALADTVGRINNKHITIN